MARNECTSVAGHSDGHADALKQGTLMQQIQGHTSTRCPWKPPSGDYSLRIALAAARVTANGLTMQNEPTLLAKGFNAFQSMQGGVKKYKFMDNHPGYKFSHLIQLKFPSIPRISLPNGKLCPLDELDLNCTNPPHHVVGKCEMYAKIALLMFFPFRQLNNLKTDGSYWR